MLWLRGHERNEVEGTEKAETAAPEFLAAGKAREAVIWPTSGLKENLR